MTFTESVESCFSKYVTFSGRASRSEYWWFYLAYILACFAGGFTDGLLGTSFISLIAYLVMLLPCLAVGVRRMHDTGHSGWWLIVPIANIVFCVIEGEHGVNKYGDRPE